MTTTEKAAEMRAAFKGKGWTGRQVSVRAKYFSLGSSISVHVKDPAIPLEPVKEIARLAEHVRRDERTGEILGGGNTYVDVGYTSEALEIIGRRYADDVQRAVNECPVGSSSLVRIARTPYLIGRPDESRLTLWHEGAGHIVQAYHVNEIAKYVGSLMVGREEETRPR